MSKLDNCTYSTEGAPKDPLCGFQNVDAESDKGRGYDYRLGAAGAEGSIFIGHFLTPQEIALWNVFNKENKFISLNNSNQPISSNDLLRYTDYLSIVDQIKQNEKISRLIGYDQTKDLHTIGNIFELNVLENINSYNKLDKSGLVEEATKLCEKNPDSPLRPFGKIFNTLPEINNHVEELFQHGLGVVIKIDETESGGKFSSGIGVFIAKNKDEWRQAKDKILNLNITSPKGIVQMYVPNHGVASITSEQDTNTKEYNTLEAHIQRQKQGVVADGAEPLRNKDADNLLGEIWPALQEIYKSVNMSGGQNMNFLVIRDPKVREKASKLYGGKPDNFLFVPMDPNVRPISGTKMAMLNFMRQTNSPLNLSTPNGFSYGSTEVHPVMANNPALLYHAAKMIGLTPGNKGDFAVVNYGYTTPDVIKDSSDKRDKTSIKILIGNRNDANKKHREFIKLVSQNPKKVINDFSSTYEQDPHNIISNSYANKVADMLTNNLATVIEK